MWQSVRRISAALICFFIAMVANGYFSTLISLEIQKRGAGPFVVGIISAAFYAGLILGSFRIEKFIAKVGYVRAYATFAAFGVVLTLLQAFCVAEPLLSLLIRFFFGACVGVFFVVLEGWVMASSTQKNRGVMMSICMITLYLGYSSGQFFVAADPLNILTPFIIIAIILSVSIIPLAAVRQEDPGFAEASLLGVRDLYRLSPTGIIGCVLTGVAFSTLYSIFPIMLSRFGYERADISLAMFVIVFGGMVFQYPFGRLSDIFGRKKVLLLLSGLTGLLALLSLLTGDDNTRLSLCVYGAIGGACYPLYPVVLSHACDVVSKKDMTAAMQGLVLMFGAGSTIGPIYSGVFMEIFGPFGVLLGLAVSMALMLGVFLWRSRTGDTITPDQQKDFVPASTGTLFFAKEKRKAAKKH